MNNNLKLIILTILVIILLAFVYILKTDKEIKEGEGCGDACSATSTPIKNGWKEFKDATSSVSFMYPETLGTEYIRAVDWPPALQVIHEKYSCNIGGNEIDRAGRTDEIEIAGMKYCVTTLDEGAAGSIYSQYAYAFSVESDTYILTFTTRQPQCGNFDEDKMKECEKEINSFNVNTLISGIVQTMKKI